MRTRLYSLLATGVIAVGATIPTAPTANAIPEKQIQSECAAANGGKYSTGINKITGQRISTCDWHDGDGNGHTDTYVNGDYQGTYDWGLQAPPSTKPGPPPLAPNQGLSPPPAPSEPGPPPPPAPNRGMSP
jgi:hypothetical protein